MIPIGPDRPLVIAHRGASRDRPENTLAAFDEALRQGADGIELDVQLSLDGHLIVWHDRTLLRAGGGRRSIAGRTLDDLASLRIEGEPLATLDDVLARYASRTLLLIELKIGASDRDVGKRRELARRVAAKLQGPGDDTCVVSFDAEVLRLVGEYAGRTPTGLTWDRKQRVSRLPRGHALISVDVAALRPELVERAHAEGIAVATWTCNSLAAVRRARKAGADAILTDRPGWLVHHVRG